MSNQESKRRTTHASSQPTESFTMKRHAGERTTRQRPSAAPTRTSVSRPQRRILRALAPVLIFSITSVITQWIWFSSHDTDHLRNQRLGLVNFVEDANSLWGVYSIHQQMERFHMLPSVEHVVVVTSDTPQKTKNILKDWLGPGNVREMDKRFIMDKVHDSLKREDFAQIEAFNMLHFDKLIVLDSDTLIRKSLLDWFDNPAPAATQAKGTMEWMTGAMMIEPDKRLYRTLLEYLPLSRRWIPSQDNGKDTWNSGDSYRGFLSSFLLSKATDNAMFTLDYGSFVQSSDMQERKENQYFFKYRPNSIETFHFDKATPWRYSASFTRQPATCALLLEWAETVVDAPESLLPELPKFLKKCNTTGAATWATKYI